MTGNEIIAQVRRNYGDADVNFIPDAALEGWLNQAVQEVYTFLPPSDMRECIESDSVAINASTGRGTIPDTWDHIVSVYGSTDGELIRLPSHFTNSMANLSAYFTPDAGGYAIDGNQLLVTPFDIGTVTVQYLAQPDEITDFSSEVAGVPTRYHPTLVDWVTSLAYASEEDAQQASFYANRAQAALRGRLGTEEG